MAYPKSFLLSFFLGILFEMTLSEFQFCLNGPQKVTDSECPGGILLTKAIDSPCLILARDDNFMEARASLNSSICGKGGEASVLVSQATDTTETEAKDGETSFQYIRFDHQLATTPPAKGIKILDKEGCMKDCLKDWIDPTQDLEEEPEYDFGIPPAPGDTIKEQTQITKDLFTFMHFDYDTVTNLRDLNIFNVLREALDVLEKHCHPPYVDTNFISHIFAALRFVVIKTGARTKINDLGTREHSLVVDALRRCKDNPMKFHINGSTCGDSSKIRAIDDVSYRRDGKAYRWGKFDLMIEAAWSAIEFVHGYCFREYSSDLSFQHILVRAMDALFSNKVQMRWMYPTKLNEDTYWENMVGVKDANSTMRNIDFCVQGSRPYGPYNDRLGRPFEKQPGTYTASTGTTGGQGGNAVDSPKAGWPTDNLDDYWQKYDSKGGFKNAIRPYGFCLSGSSDLVDKVPKVTAKCPPAEKNPDYDPDLYE